MPDTRFAHLHNLFRTSAFRLTWLYLVVFCASVTVLLWFIYRSTVTVIDRQTMETVEAEIRGLAEQYRQQGIGRLVEVIRQRSETARGEDVYLLTDANFRQLAGNLSAWPQDGDPSGPWVDFKIWRKLEGANVSFRVRARAFVLPGGYRLLVGRDTYERARFRSIVENAITWSLGGAVVLGIGGGLFLSRRLLQRVDQVSRTARQIIAGDLSGRVQQTGSGDEFDRLAESVNAMLDQIERLMTGMRLATDSLAHDLRGPLTRLRGRIEIALRHPPDAVRDREALADILAQAEAALVTFDSLLRIATAEAGFSRADLKTVDLVTVARDATELYEPLAEEKGIAMALIADTRVAVQGQPELLAQAVVNLIDNAVKYTPGGGRIWVSVAMAGDAAELSVADSGPGIPEADRGRVLERFVRLEECRQTVGAGLGLSLVASVAKLHDATLSLADNAPGLRVTLRFPAATAAAQGENGALGA